MEKNLTFDEMLSKVLEIIPYASFEEDSYGQIVIYTDLMMDEDLDGPLVRFKEPEDEDE